MSSQEGREITEGFAWVREVYRSGSLLLRSSDAMMLEYGFYPYKWRAAEDPGTSYDRPEQWARHRVVRQYHQHDGSPHDIFTIGLVFFWPEEVANFPEPLCIVSYMDVKHINCNDVYWPPLSQIHEAQAPADGVVRELNPAHWGLNSKVFQNGFNKYSASGRIVSAALPLVQITSTSLLKQRLVEPVVGVVRQTFSRSADDSAEGQGTATENGPNLDAQGPT